MGLSLGHLIIILIIVLVLFGAGKLPQIMSDMAKGMKAFKDGMKEEDQNHSSNVSNKDVVPAPKQIKSTKAKSSKVVKKTSTKDNNKTKTTKNTKSKIAKSKTTKSNKKSST